MTTAQLIQTYNGLPDALKKEVDHYLEYIAQKVAQETKAQEPKPDYKIKERGAYGSMKGMFKMSDDFDAPLEDFKDYM